MKTSDSNIKSKTNVYDELLRVTEKALISLNYETKTAPITEQQLYYLRSKLIKQLGSYKEV